MFIINGFLLGLSTGVFCLTWCAPVFVALVLNEKKKGKEFLFLFLEFIFGRFIGYILFGALVGYLGVRIQSEIIKKINLTALIVLAVLLIFYGLGLLNKKRACYSSKKDHLPIFAGLLTGVNFCPPFLIAISYVFNEGGVLRGIGFFLSFFVATSLYLIPLIFFSLLNKSSLFQRMAKYVSVLIGIVFLIYGLSGFSTGLKSCFNCPFFKIENLLGYSPLIIFCLLFLFSIFLFVKQKYSRLRYLVLFFSMLYFGFILRNVFCPIRTFQMLFIDGAKIVANLILFLFFLLPIILALLWGEIYCRYLCPLGAFQEFIFQGGKLTKCSCFRKKILPKGQWQNYFRYFFLAFTVLLLLIFRKPILCGVDPFGALFSRFITTASIVFLALLIILSLFIYRPWCRFFCPYGAFLSLLSKLSFFQKDKKDVNSQNNITF